MITLIGSGSTIAQELEADNFEHISQVRSVILQITSSNFFFLLLGIIVVIVMRVFVVQYFCVDFLILSL